MEEKQEQEVQFNGICHYLPYKETVFSWHEITDTTTLSSTDEVATYTELDYADIWYQNYVAETGFRAEIKYYGRYTAAVKIKFSFSGNGTLWIKTNCASAFYTSAKDDEITVELPVSRFCPEYIGVYLTSRNNKTSTVEIKSINYYAPQVFESGFVSPFTPFPLTTPLTKASYQAMLPNIYWSHAEAECPDWTAGSGFGCTYYKTKINDLRYIFSFLSYEIPDDWDVVQYYNGPLTQEECYSGGYYVGAKELAYIVGNPSIKTEYPDYGSTKIYVKHKNLMYLPDGYINLFEIETINGWRASIDSEPVNKIPYIYSHNSMYMRDFLFFKAYDGDLRTTKSTEVPNPITANDLPVPPTTVKATFAKYDGTIVNDIDVKVVYKPITKMYQIWLEAITGYFSGEWPFETPSVAASRVGDSDIALCNLPYKYFYYVNLRGWPDWGEYNDLPNYYYELSPAYKAYWRNPQSMANLDYMYANPFFISHVMPFAPITKATMPDWEGSTTKKYDIDFKFQSVLAHCTVINPATFLNLQVYLKQTNGGDKTINIPSEKISYNKYTGLLNIPLVYEGLYEIKKEGENLFKDSSGVEYKLYADYYYTDDNFTNTRCWGGLNFATEGSGGKMDGLHNVAFENLNKNEYLWFSHKAIEKDEEDGNVNGFLPWHSDSVSTSVNGVYYNYSDIYRNVLWLREYIRDIMFDRILPASVYEDYEFYPKNDGSNAFRNPYRNSSTSLMSQYVYGAPVEYTNLKQVTTTYSSDITAAWCSINVVDSQIVYIDRMKFFQNYEQVVAYYTWNNDNFTAAMKLERKEHYSGGGGGTVTGRGKCGLYCLYAYKKGNNDNFYCRRSLLANDHKPTNIEIKNETCSNPNFISAMQVCFVLSKSRDLPTTLLSQTKIGNRYTIPKLKGPNERQYRYVYIKVRGTFDKIYIYGDYNNREYTDVDGDAQPFQINFMSYYPDTFVIEVDGAHAAEGFEAPLIWEVGAIEEPADLKPLDTAIAGHSDLYTGSTCPTLDFQQYCMPLNGNVVQDLQDFVRCVMRGEKYSPPDTRVF